MLISPPNETPNWEKEIDQTIGQYYNDRLRNAETIKKKLLFYPIIIGILIGIIIDIAIGYMNAWGAGFVLGALIGYGLWTSHNLRNHI